jgi:hypothetical protein
VEYDAASVDKGIPAVRRKAVMFLSLKVMPLRCLETLGSRYLLTVRIITDEQNRQPRRYEDAQNKHKLMSQLNSSRFTHRVIKQYVA